MTQPISLNSPILYSDALPDAADVVVIGGGIIGVSTALHLARAGQKVVLCEKGRLGGEQSSRNWGWIRQQGRDPDELPIMVEAARIWSDLSAQTNVDIGLRKYGVTYLAQTEDKLARFSDWVQFAQAQGVDTKILTRAQTAALSPTMSQSFVGSLHTASDMQAEPWVAVPALAGIASREGAIIAEGCAVRCLEQTSSAVTAVVTEQGVISTPRVVVAGGAWSALFLRAHNVTIPQLSVRASVCATAPLPDIGPGAFSDGKVAWRRRADGGYSLAPSGFHELFIGPDAFRALPKFIEQLKADPFGTRFFPASPKGYPDAWGTKRSWTGQDITPFEAMRVLDPSPNKKKLQQLVRNFSNLFPDLGTVDLAHSWAGMIDTMPDVVPVMDTVASIPGLSVATGFSGHGFGIGPGVGRVMADLAMGRDPGHDLTRFRLSRFTDGSKIDLGPAL